MKDGRETGFLEEHRNGEPYALKGARTVRKGPERKGLAPVPRSQATLRSSSASVVSKAPRCRYSSTTSEAVNGGSRQTGEEEFINHARTRDPNRTLLFASWMGRHHHAARDAIRPQRHIRTVLERAYHPTFRVGQMLIGRQGQASLDLGPLQDLRVFPTHHKRQPGQVGKNSSSAILSVEAQQNPFFGMVMRHKIALNGRDGPTQFGTVFPIAGVSKRAQKLMRMRLQRRGPAPHNFPSLASGVARSAQRAQTPLWLRPIRRLRQSPLAGGLTCAIHVKDDPPTSLSVP